MTLHEAAAILGLSVRTLQVQARLGVLKARKHGRDWLVTATEVQRYEREHLRKGTGHE